MKSNDNVKVLRIYTSSTDKLKHTPMYEMIVFAARRNGMAGATVHKGVMGYGSSSVVHSAKFWETILNFNSHDKVTGHTAYLLFWSSAEWYRCFSA